MAGLSSSTGLISGINYNDLLTQLVAVEKQPITLLQNKKSSLQTVSAELSTLSVRLSSLRTASNKLSSLSNFNVNTVSVGTTASGATLLSASAARTAVTGTTQVKVNQLAQPSSIASQGFVDIDTTPVASTAGTLTFKVGTAGAETSINVTTSTTLVQLRDAINSANGAVTASIINDGSGSNPYRLVLTAKESGAANVITVSSNPTELDFGNKLVEAAYAKTTNSYSGTVSSNEGNNYTGTTNKTFLVEIVTGGDPGTADYKYSIDGGITFLGVDGDTFDGTNAISTRTSLQRYIDNSTQGNSINEGVQISFGASSGTLVAGDQFTIDVFNPTLQSAQDAVIQVGNLTLAKSSNTISDVIQGVTLNLLQADSSQTIDVTVGNDTSGVSGPVDEFISAYNDVMSYLDDQLSYDPNKGDAAKPLLGDATALLLKRQIQNLITSVVPGSSSGLNSLAKLGFTTNVDTSKISLDQGKFQAALSKSLTDVTRLFIGIGVPSNSQIDYVGKTENTNTGSYGVLINTAPTRATVLGSNPVPSGGITATEVISVSLYSNATLTSNTPTTAQITAAAGSTINDIINALNTAFATNKMAISASNNNGTIQIRAQEYGDDYKIQVLSNLNDPSNQSGFSTTLSEDTGVDIAGTINGFKANGLGAVLTSASGFAEDGLSIRAEVSSPGNFGTVTVSSGIADRMVALLDAAVNATTGNIKVRQDGIAKTIKGIDADIEKKNLSVSQFQQRTLERFQRLELLLGQFQAQSQALSSSLTSIQNLATTISRR